MTVITKSELRNLWCLLLLQSSSSNVPCSLPYCPKILLEGVVIINSNKCVCLCVYSYVCVCVNELGERLYLKTEAYPFDLPCYQ